MMALTLKHPWPFAIARLGKRVENRGWKPANELVGRVIALHGGKHVDASSKPQQERAELARAWGWILGCGLGAGVEPTLENLILEGIFAVARYGGAVHMRSDDPLTRDPWFEGVYGWKLEDLVVLPEPIPCRGAQGLWRVPPDVRKEISRQCAGMLIDG